MMAVPKQKKTRARRDSRRSTHYIKRIQVSRCPRCGEDKLPHRVCLNCGYYKDMQVMEAEE